MITISASCCFAAYNSETKELESSIITIDEFTTIVCNADEKKTKSDTIFCATRSSLVTQLNAKSVTYSDKTPILDDDLKARL